MPKLKSKYLFDLIKKTRYRDRQQIYDLINLEDYILGGYTKHGFANAMKIHGLMCSYEHEYALLLKELDPKEYRSFLAERKASNKEMKKLEKQEKMDAKLEKNAWIKAGGQL